MTIDPDQIYSELLTVMAVFTAVCGVLLARAALRRRATSCRPALLDSEADGYYQRAADAQRRAGRKFDRNGWYLGVGLMLTALVCTGVVLSHVGVDATTGGVGNPDTLWPLFVPPMVWGCSIMIVVVLGAPVLGQISTMLHKAHGICSRV